MGAFAAGVLLALLQGTVCPDCRGDARRPVLCAPHADAENIALREQRVAYSKGASADERVSALERVAALTRTHSNAPSPAVARFLVDGLKDEALSVRRRALALLLDGQHREETLRGVLDGWREAQKAWRVLDAKLVLSEAGPDSKDESVALTTEELSEVPEYMAATLRALGKLRDERALSALATFVRSPLDRTPGRFLVAGAEALLELDSRRACEVVIALLESLEDAFVEGQVPRRFQSVGRTDLLASLKSPLENASEHDHAEIVELLGRYAASKGSAAPESSEPLRSSDWKVWFRAVRDSLPERVTPP